MFHFSFVGGLVTCLFVPVPLLDPLTCHNLHLAGEEYRTQFQIHLLMYFDFWNFIFSLPSHITCFFHVVASELEFLCCPFVLNFLPFVFVTDIPFFSPNLNLGNECLARFLPSTKEPHIPRPPLICIVYVRIRFCFVCVCIVCVVWSVCGRDGENR